jgi:hypothetical protein
MNAVRKFFLAIGFIGVLFVSFSNAPFALACSCVMTTPAEQFDNAAVVFVGMVSSIVADGSNNSVDFNVSKLRKGSSVETITVKTHQQESACGFDFKVGNEYVVYAYEEYGDLLGTNICTGTISVVDFQDDVDDLGFANGPSELIIETKNSANSLVLIIVSSVLSFVAGALVIRVAGDRKKTR